MWLWPEVFRARPLLPIPAREESPAQSAIEAGEENHDRGETPLLGKRPWLRHAPAATSSPIASGTHCRLLASNRRRPTSPNATAGSVIDRDGNRSAPIRLCTRSNVPDRA